MILTTNFETNKFNEFIIDLFLLEKKYKLDPFGVSMYPNVFCQGYGLTYGSKMVICDIKNMNLSENYILNESVNFSQTLFQERPTVQEFYIIFRQELTPDLKNEFTNRLPSNLKKVATVYDLNDIQNKAKDYTYALQKYENEFKTWYEVYQHIAFFLYNHYENNFIDCAQIFYSKISTSTYLENNSRRFFQYKSDENEFGLDPIQIFASFNYSGINKIKRIENINNLLVAIGSLGRITDSIDFEGIPSPIIRSIVYNRKVEAQNQIWNFFARIYILRSNEPSETEFNALYRWKGIQIPSLTMFLFWVNSEKYLPLDINTVNYLKTIEIIDERPKNYKEYTELCSKKAKLSDSINVIDIKDVFRNIVKEAYTYYEKKSNNIAISGSTQTLISKETGKKEDEKQLETKLLKDRKEQFKNFKIIAVRPRERKEFENNSYKHIKNLKEGRYYCLYKAYKFKLEDDTEIDYDPSLDIEIYNDSNLNISISAIVGMNGSGKSAIADIIYLVINRIAYEKKIRSSEKIQKEIIYADLFIKSDKLYKISVGEKIEVFVFEPNETNTKYLKVTPDFDGEKMFKKFDVESLCYSVVLNYSLYGLNSKTTGTWINPLFHKNDSYQVPIVLNPKRNEGIIDVNIENDLAKSRLLMNLLEPKLIDFDKDEIPALSPGAKPLKLKIELNDDKIERKRKKYKKYTNENNIEIVFKALNIEVNESSEFSNEAKEYIYYKLISIADNYPEKYKKFQRLHRWIDDNQKLETYLKKLSEDSSHITFKLKQAINYLAYNLYKSKAENFVIEISKSIDEIINTDSDNELRTIDLIPPSFLKTNVLFQHGGDFDSLSSGEKQQIYSINTIAYHLFNLKSVLVYENILKYNSINIIFDEVELYFHPDLQRTYIKNLRDRILSLELNSEKDINNINIIFITHSPFILSDIPNANVLMLQLDKETKKSFPIENNYESFGANVHDLLANEFFMENGFMGEFAKNKIEQTILHLNYIKLKSEYILGQEKKDKDDIDIIENRKIMLELIGVIQTINNTSEIEYNIDLINKYIDEIKIDPRELKLVIDNIGEQVIRLKLLDMYNEVFAKESHEDIIRKKIRDMGSIIGYNVELIKKN